MFEHRLRLSTETWFLTLIVSLGPPTTKRVICKWENKSNIMCRIILYNIIISIRIIRIISIRIIHVELAIRSSELCPATSKSCLPLFFIYEMWVLDDSVGEGKEKREVDYSQNLFSSSQFPLFLIWIIRLLIFPTLLKYTWQLKLCIFKVYVIGYMYTLWNDDHNQSN